uniref:Uncharacterized protein n=1 Tax=Rhizophora mucronata TaxID=61149 RepID=A0A2P2NGL6_RHIMU
MERFQLSSKGPFLIHGFFGESTF